MHTEPDLSVADDYVDDEDEAAAERLRDIPPRPETLTIHQVLERERAKARARRAERPGRPDADPAP